MKYGILFDLDGTLWDSSNTVAPAWNEVMASEGLTVTPAIMRSMMGKTLMEIGKALLPALSPERHKALTDECSRLECIRLRENGAYLFPDVKETLERLKKQYYLGLVSNCQVPYKEAFLHYYHFESLFDGTLCAGETGREAAVRETREELGLDVEIPDSAAVTLEFEGGFDDFFLITQDVPLEALTLQTEEVQAARWASESDVIRMLHDGTFAPYWESFIHLLFDLHSHTGLQA